MSSNHQNYIKKYSQNKTAVKEVNLKRKNRVIFTRFYTTENENQTIDLKDQLSQESNYQNTKVRLDNSKQHSREAQNKSQCQVRTKIKTKNAESKVTKKADQIDIKSIRKYNKSIKGWRDEGNCESEIARQNENLDWSRHFVQKVKL